MNLQFADKILVKGAQKVKWLSHHLRGVYVITILAVFDYFSDFKCLFSLSLQSNYRFGKPDELPSTQHSTRQWLVLHIPQPMQMWLITRLCSAERQQTLGMGFGDGGGEGEGKAGKGGAREAGKGGKREGDHESAC